MAVRDLLHLSKVDKFRDYMEAKGWVSATTKGAYEVLRLIKPGEKPIILFHKHGCDHATFENRIFPYVRQFIMDSRREEQQP